MQIQCDCGKFQAKLSQFPKNTPGRSVCYCIDCRAYLHHINRAELLDEAGGTEIIPVYPSEMAILQGQDLLQCTRLSDKGLYRWSTKCCSTPVGNVTPGFPWVGLISRVFTNTNTISLEKTLGPIKCRIFGKYATNTPPVGTSQSTSFADFKSIFPFILKGFIGGKMKPSPFFPGDGKAPLVEPKILSPEERAKIY